MKLAEYSDFCVVLGWREASGIYIARDVLNMNRIFHITFGNTAKATLKHFFMNSYNKFNGEVIALQGNLSIGPIYEIDTKLGIRRRITWLKDTLKIVSTSDYFEDVLEEE